MKNNIDYFSHYTDAHNNGKFLILRAYYGGDKGWAMEGRFWALNCLIGKAENCRLDLKSKAKRAEVVQALNLTLAELDDFLRVLKDEAELLKEEDGVYFTEQTQDDLTRAMSVRIEAQNRRNGKVGRPSDDEGKTSADDLDSSDDKTHRAEQSREEKRRAAAGKQAIASREEESQADPPDSAMPAAACPVVTPKEVKSLCVRAPFPLRLSPLDSRNIAERLSAESLDPGFVEYVLLRAQDTSVRNAGAFARSALLGGESFSGMPGEYRAEKEAAKDHEHKRDPPPAVCDECGAPIRWIPTQSDAFCSNPSCGAIWDRAEAVGWVKLAEKATALRGTA